MRNVPCLPTKWQMVWQRTLHMSVPGMTAYLWHGIMKRPILRWAEMVRRIGMRPNSRKSWRTDRILSISLKNGADHPEEQANPDNIKFYKNRKQHLEEGHDGNWKNECDGPMNDKNKMLEKTNAKRVFRNELRGLGLAVAIGAGVGLTIGFVSTLAQMGITPDTLKLAAAESIKSGVESGLTSRYSLHTNL